MIPIHSCYDVPYELKKIAQRKLKEIVKHYFITNANIYGENGYSYLFPEYLYDSKKISCDSAVKELKLWSQDPYERPLKPIHEYILYRILKWANAVELDFQSDTDESLFFSDLPQKFSNENNEWILADLSQLDFYFTVCFLDFDFTHIETYINSLQDYSIEAVENRFDIDLKSFRELMPLDIEEKLFGISSTANNNINISNLNNSVVIIGNDNNLNYTNKSKIDSDIEDLISYIFKCDNLSNNEIQDLFNNSQELKKALKENNTNKASIIYNRLSTTLGNVSSLTTIGQFISGISNVL